MKAASLVSHINVLGKNNLVCFAKAVMQHLMILEHRTEICNACFQVKNNSCYFCESKIY